MRIQRVACSSQPANLTTAELGVVILGTLGHVDFVQEHLRAKINSHGTLLERIPSVVDLQAAWLILLFCASSRASFLLNDKVVAEVSVRVVGSGGSIGHLGHRQFAIVSGRVGPLERTADQACGKLGQLERFPRNGAEPSP